MLVFHRKPISILLSTEITLFGCKNLIKKLKIPDANKRLPKVFQFFKRKNNESFTIESHIVDTIAPLLGDPRTFLVYLTLNRMSDQELIITTTEDLINRLCISKSELLDSLSILEENLLIKISGNQLLKIQINKNWF